MTRKIKISAHGRMQVILSLMSSISMKYFFTVLLLFAALALTMAGCDSSETGSEEEDGESLIPLAEGNTWTATNNATQETVRLRVAGTESISEQSYFRVNTLTGSATVTGGSANPGSPLYVQERDDGVYIGIRRSESMLEGFFLRYPISDGSTYVHTNEEGDAFDVTVTERSVTVPAGTFDAVQYRILDQAADNADERAGITVIAAPGVGPLQLSSAQNTVRLTRFELQ
jgi:hypothetical protein